MIFPSADTIEDKIGSRYSLVVLAAKRAKQIKEGAPLLIDTDSTNPLTIALEEIAAGKVTVIEADALTPQPDPDAGDHTADILGPRTALPAAGTAPGSSADLGPDEDAEAEDADEEDAE